MLHVCPKLPFRDLQRVFIARLLALHFSLKISWLEYNIKKWKYENSIKCNINARREQILQLVILPFYSYRYLTYFILILYINRYIYLFIFYIEILCIA